MGMTIYIGDTEMQSLRLKKIEAELLKTKCREINRARVKEDKPVITESQLLHSIVENGLVEGLA